MRYSFSARFFKILAYTLCLISLFISSNLYAQNIHWAKAPENPIELGDVHWLRNYSEAVEKSKKTNKPIFILFQEVPGCGTCQRYGQNILSHPLLVEVIESHFVPLAIYNNKGGNDKTILRKFNEPSWNNPVVRIVNYDGNDIISRLSAKYDLLSVTTATISALTASNQLIPKYLQLLETELNAEKYQEEAYLSMYCFWTGEKEIAKIPGVIKTEAGFMDGREVVKVSYDSNITSLEKIRNQADKNSCAQRVYVDDKKKHMDDLFPAKNFRKDKESKYFLYKSKYSTIPMTSYQAMLVNSFLGQRKNPEEIFSPRQLSFLGKGTESLIGLDIRTAWKKAMR